RGPRHRRSVLSRRAMAVPARAQCRGGGLRDRDAEAAVELRDRPLPRWTRQQLRSRWAVLHRAGKPGGLGSLEEGSSRLQGTAIACADGALELRRQQGVLRRLLLYEPGSSAAALGQHAGRGPWLI